jgi:hypothetical protein
MLAAIRRFIDDLDSRWADFDHDLLVFPETAAACLRSHELHQHVGPEEILQWAMRANRLPEQFDLTASFGEPPLTLGVADRFFVDAYFWVSPDTVIHDHGFAGAFMNLAGNSLMCVYRFCETAAPHPALRVGELALDHADYLSPGSVVPIPPGRAFIHRVWHLSRPTVTLLARVPSVGAPFEQWRYVPPGLAAKKAWPRPPEVLRRQHVLTLLYQTRHAARERWAREAVFAPDLFDACEALQHYYALNLAELSRAELWGRVDELVARLRDRHGPWAVVLADALRVYDAERRVNWERVTDPEDRLLLACQLTFGMESMTRPRTEAGEG